MLLGCDITGRRYDFIPVTPNLAEDEPDFVLDNETRWEFVKPLKFHRAAAVEANNQLGIEAWSVVRMHFAGYGKDKRPMYVFHHTPPLPSASIVNHDHRDNLNGGFAFSVYHPGTAVPQMPWFV